MNMVRATQISALLCCAIAVFFLSGSSSAASDTFIFARCSQLKFTPNSAYESNLNSLLTTIVNSAAYTSYSNFSAGTVHGLFQCRGDVGGDCARCVARAVSQLGTVCVDSSGGAVQLDGCFVRYDNATFIGVKDESVLFKKCGPSVGYALTRRDEALDYLAATSGGGFIVSGTGDVQGVGQCLGDLTPGDCRDCLSAAVRRLKTECASAAAWGDMFLPNCYARYFEHGEDHPHGGYGSGEGRNDDETEKTLAILIGIIAGVALLIVFLSFLAQACGKGAKGGK